MTRKEGVTDQTTMKVGHFDNEIFNIKNKGAVPNRLKKDFLFDYL